MFVEKKYIKCNIWRIAVRPSFILDARFLKVKAWVCGRSLTGIEGSNTAGGMVVCPMRVLCVVRQSSVRRADNSS